MEGARDTGIHGARDERLWRGRGTLEYRWREMRDYGERARDERIQVVWREMRDLVGRTTVEYMGAG
jgi:hypothetical protein